MNQKVSRLKNFGPAWCAHCSISFYVEEGEFFGFLTPNGAGKNTTIKRTLLENSYYSSAERGCVLE
jgi:ABC-type multidrug transport system ATPase subunit